MKTATKPPPRLFTRHCTLDELQVNCRKRRWKLDRRKFDEGSDYVSFDWRVGEVSGCALFSCINGRFFGETSAGVRFTSDNSEHEGEAWFDALLDATYVGEVAT